MEDGGATSGETGGVRRSRLLDYAEMSEAAPSPAPTGDSEPLISDDVGPRAA